MANSTSGSAEVLTAVGDDLISHTVYHETDSLLRPDKFHQHHQHHQKQQNNPSSHPHKSNYKSTSADGANASSMTPVVSDDNGSDSESEDEDEHSSGEQIYDADGHKYPKELRLEFLKLPKWQRPNYKLLLFGLAITIAGVSSAATSILDTIVYLVCLQDFPIDSAGGSGPTSPLPISSLANSVTTGFNDPRCFNPQISAAAGLFQSYMTTAGAIFSAISIPFLASLSDRIGRRPVLMIAVSASLIYYIILLACISFPGALSYKFILFGSMINGLGGSELLIMVLIASYISDSIREAYRAPILSIADALIYGGLAIGPTLGSIFLNLTNHSLPGLFISSICAQFGFLVMIFFFLSESRSDKARRKSVIQFNKFSSSRKNSMATTRSSLRTSFSSPLHNINEEAFEEERDVTFYQSMVITVSGMLSSVKDGILHPMEGFQLKHIPRRYSRLRLNVYILMATLSIIMEIAVSVIPLIFLYAKIQFQWTSVENGYFISLLSSTRFIVLALFLPYILTWFHTHYDHSKYYVDKSDKFFLCFGLLASSIGYFLLSRAPNGTVFLLTTLFFGFSSCENPVLKNTLIKHASQGNVAELLGLSQFISRVFSIFVPALFAYIFNKTVSYRPQIVIEMTVGLFLLLLILVNFLYVGPPEGVADDERVIPDVEVDGVEVR